MLKVKTPKANSLTTLSIRENDFKTTISLLIFVLPLNNSIPSKIFSAPSCVLLSSLIKIVLETLYTGVVYLMYAKEINEKTNKEIKK